MKKINIPPSEFKFLKTVKSKICPKCNSTDVFDTGYWADNIDHGVDKAPKVPHHPVYRCAKCAQLFRIRRPEKK